MKAIEKMEMAAGENFEQLEQMVDMVIDRMKENIIKHDSLMLFKHYAEQVKNGEALTYQDYKLTGADFSNKTLNNQLQTMVNMWAYEFMENVEADTFDNLLVDTDAVIQEVKSR